MRIPKIDELPLFPNERDIALVVVGPERAKDWRGIAQTLEKKGFPKIDVLHGGRKLADVLAWYGDPTRSITLADLPKSSQAFTIAPYAEDGVEDFSPPPRSRGRRKT